MLNPETLVMRRTAGVRPRRSSSGQLTGAGLADDPVLYTGGGRTILELDLLFDLGLADSSVRSVDAGAAAVHGADVRALTRPLWQMAENTVRQASARQASAGNLGYAQPPQVRFIWGKAWNVPAVVLAVAERFERFTPQGNAQRSWLRLLLLRINETPPRPMVPEPFYLADVPPADDLGAPDERWEAHEVIEGERLDQVAARQYGAPSLWRLIAAVNDVDDPAAIVPGQLLRLPPRPRGGTR
jgi:hypothetical protein